MNCCRLIDNLKLKDSMFMKILLIDFLYIGDLLFTTPLIHELYSLNPQPRIDMLIDQKYADVMKYNPYLHEVIAVERAGLRGHPLNNIRLIRKIRASQYDVVINLHRNERTTVFTAFSGAKSRIGYARKGPYGLLFTQKFDAGSQLHIVDEYLSFLDYFELTRRGYGLEMYVDAPSRAEADQMWRAAGLEGRRAVGVNAGSNWPSKRWLGEGYAKLAELLVENNLTPVFFGGETDRVLVREILALTTAQPVVFTGKISLLHLAALAKKCAVFVSGDSGPAHIAASQGVPTVVIYGPSTPERFHPYGVKHININAGVSCSPCKVSVCAAHKCMKNISPREVLTAVQELLTAP